MKICSEKEIAEIFLSPDFDNILIACHVNPDGDAVGSAWSLAAGLEKLGKKVKCFCSDRIGQDFSYISSRFQSGDFEIKKIVTCDVAAPEMLGEVDFADRINIAIDHHRINSIVADHKIVDADAASCGEIVLRILREMKIVPDEYMASALYTAISTDTGCFRYSNTCKSTFEAAAYLSDYAADGDFYRITKKLFETKSKKRMALEAYTASQCRYLFGEKVGFITFTSQDMERLGVQYWDLDPMINIIRQTEGVLVSVVAKEKEKDVFKVSVRSEEMFDAAEFCAQFGGGGHLRAAGCTINGNAKEVENALISALEKELN